MVISGYTIGQPKHYMSLTSVTLCFSECDLSWLLLPVGSESCLLSPVCAACEGYMLVQINDDRLHFNHNLTTGVGGGGREALPQLSLYCLAFPRTPSVMCRRMSQWRAEQ